MKSEKVKEIKEWLEYKSNVHHSVIGYNTYILINELENQNKRLSDELDLQKMTDKEYKYNMTCEKGKQFKQISELQEENQKLKDRIAELEEALLDMVVQFCQMGKEGYLNHTFMSAEENAFDVLDIGYGEKVDDVYKRFNEKWGKQ
jgi:predicted  nucleic acid-binding Zn-ribbon protein